MDQTEELEVKEKEKEFLQKVFVSLSGIMKNIMIKLGQQMLMSFGKLTQSSFIKTLIYL